MRFNHVWLFVCMSLLMQAQTKVDVSSQAKNVDFSQASATKPMKTGASLPATCSEGEFFFKTNAAPGANVYGCIAANTWAVQTGGGSGSQPGGTLGAVAVNATTLQLGQDCSPSTPCNVRLGDRVVSFTQGATVTISSGDGPAYFYVSGGGSLVVGHTMTVQCVNGCVAQSGVTGFPADSIPLFIWPATAGTWNSSGSDYRAFMGYWRGIAGAGLKRVEVEGQVTLAVDPAAVGLRMPAPASSSAVCQTGSWSSDGAYFYVCVGTNSWKRIGLMSW